MASANEISVSAAVAAFFFFLSEVAGIFAVKEEEITALKPLRSGRDVFCALTRLWQEVWLNTGAHRGSPKGSAACQVSPLAARGSPKLLLTCSTGSKKKRSDWSALKVIHRESKFLFLESRPFVFSTGSVLDGYVK